MFIKDMESEENQGGKHSIAYTLYTTLCEREVKEPRIYHDRGHEQVPKGHTGSGRSTFNL